jgi:hypothetical protein
MPDEARLTVQECRARLQQIDEALAGIVGYGGKFGVLTEKRAFFERALQRCLNSEERARQKTYEQQQSQ